MGQNWGWECLSSSVYLEEKLRAAERVRNKLFLLICKKILVMQLIQGVWTVLFLVKTIPCMQVSAWSYAEVNLSQSWMS